MSSILFGILSAISWGAGDFSGGLASRKTGPYRAVFYGEIFGLLLLLAAAGFFREASLPGRICCGAPPAGPSALWGC